MEEIKVNFSEYYTDLIYFMSKCYWDENIFLVNRNFKTTESAFKIQKYFLNLNYDLDLKYFKIEIL